MTTMTVAQAEALLSELRTRENAVACDMASDWDEAYQVAFFAYMAERNFEVDR